MPRRPQWLKDLPAITEIVEGLPSALIGRDLFEFLFNLQRTAAAYWLRRFGAQTYGTSLLIEKRILLLELYRLAASDEYQLEACRRDRLTSHLDSVRRDIAARRVRIPAGEPVKSVAELPSGVNLRPGELRINFFGTEDLLRHLFELSQAIAADYPKFQKLCGD